MKKILSVLMVLMGTVAFGHHKHEAKVLENAVKYHSAKEALHAHVAIGTHDGELLADLGELGEVHLNKIKDGYESTNKASKILVDGEKARLELRVLFYDRNFYTPEKFPEKEISFHSYNGGFPHLHLDFTKDFTKVKMGDDEFEGSLSTNKETGDKIFTEKNGKFTVTFFGKYDDEPNDHKLPHLTRIAQLNINMDLEKIK